jgi:5'-AMP-activated protein kinase, regulatory beta subunit
MGTNSSRPNVNAGSTDSQSAPDAGGTQMPGEDGVESPAAGQDMYSASGNSLGSIVPTIFTWTFGGHSVSVTGAWDHWAAKVPLAKNGGEHSAVLNLPVGSYQYKFIVDGNWKHSSSLPTETDQHGNLNNVVIVSPHFPEYDSNVPLTGLSGPPSPIESYDLSMPAKEDYSVEPAALPPLFKSAPLNPQIYDPGPLNPTAYVCLNHLFSAAPEHPAEQTRTVATVHRYKSNKYVTTVMIVNTNSSASHSTQASAAPHAGRPVHGPAAGLPSPALHPSASPPSGAPALPEVGVAGSDSHV